MHFLVSLLTLATHIAAANEEAHEENETTTTSRSVNDPHREERFLAKAEGCSGTVISRLDKQIGSAWVSDVLRVPRVPKFMGIICISHLFDDKAVVQDCFIKPWVYPDAINESE